MTLSFLLNQQPVTLDNVAADTTILELVREHLDLRGTKEGCASGDCGACTVVIGELSGQHIQYHTVNSCITFAHQLQGKQLITVEHLQQIDGTLHPVQQALVDFHGSQCGFCTPGFVMSMFNWYHSDQAPTHHNVAQALAGNLCRCTGYQPIINAALYVGEQRQPDQFDQQAEHTQAALQALTATTEQDAAVTGYWHPTDRQQLAQLRQHYPTAQLVAGSTDLALAKTQQQRQLPQLIDVTRVDELQTLTVVDEQLKVGAAVPFSRLTPVLLQYWPALTELFERLGSQPIRNQGTLGGNLGNASPIGDCAPWLAALDATVVTHDGKQSMSFPVADFFTSYRQTRMAADAWIDHVLIPLPKPQQILAAYKVSKRFDDDISTVCCVPFLTLDTKQNIQQLRIGFGGVAATPVVADVSAALRGHCWTQSDTLELLLQQLAGRFQPIDDVRASGQYRNQLITGLIKRFWYQHAQHISSRVTDYA